MIEIETELRIRHDQLAKGLGILAEYVECRIEQLDCSVECRSRYFTREVTCGRSYIRVSEAGFRAIALDLLMSKQCRRKSIDIVLAAFSEARRAHANKVFLN